MIAGLVCAAIAALASVFVVWPRRLCMFGGSELEVKPLWTLPPRR